MIVLKRKEIVAAALVVLIGVAGYMNWSYQDTVNVTDGKEYIATSKKLGEAQLVSTTEETNETASGGDYFEESVKSKEISREKALDILNSTLSNNNFDEEAKKKAQDSIIKMAESVEKESSIENLIKAKGYEKVCVYIDGENVEVVVKKDGFSDSDANKLCDIITDKLSISPSGIKIIPVK